MRREKVEKTSEDLIDGWSHQYGRSVTAGEVQEINLNLSRFFDILLRWEKQFQDKGLLDESGNFRNQNYSH